MSSIATFPKTPRQGSGCTCPGKGTCERRDFVPGALAQTGHPGLDAARAQVRQAVTDTMKILRAPVAGGCSAAADAGEDPAAALEALVSAVAAGFSEEEWRLFEMVPAEAVEHHALIHRVLLLHLRQEVFMVQWADDIGGSRSREARGRLARFLSTLVCRHVNVYDVSCAGVADAVTKLQAEEMRLAAE